MGLFPLWSGACGCWLRCADKLDVVVRPVAFVQTNALFAPLRAAPAVRAASHVWRLLVATALKLLHH
jgi:hypothetical protein